VSRQVPIKDAAAAFGVSEITVRRRIKANELLAIKHATPQGYRWLVVIEDAIEVATDPPDQLTLSPGDHPPDPVPETPTHHPDTDRLIRALEDRLAFAEDQIRFMQTQLHERTRETEQLHILLSQALQALPSGTVPPSPAPDQSADSR